MARAVRSAYDDLFQHYADANERDSEALRNYFAASSTLGSAAVGQMIGTFTAVCRLGDFKHVAERHAAPPGGSSEERKPEAARFVTGGEVLTVNINIQLQLPADATADTYERFFEAMRKHLLASGS